MNGGNMALFELNQEYSTEADKEWQMPTFKDCVAKDIDLTFFNDNEHAEYHKIDDKKDILVVYEENTIKKRSSHWEGGAKQNFDTGLYTKAAILHIKVSDYGAQPKEGKLITIDDKKIYTISTCEEQAGVYRMTLQRVRQ